MLKNASRVPRWDQAHLAIYSEFSANRRTRDNSTAMWGPEIPSGFATRIPNDWRRVNLFPSHIPRNPHNSLRIQMGEDLSSLSLYSAKGLKTFAQPSPFQSTSWRLLQGFPSGCEISIVESLSPRREDSFEVFGDQFESINECSTFLCEEQDA